MQHKQRRRPFNRISHALAVMLCGYGAVGCGPTVTCQDGICGGGDDRQTGLGAGGSSAHGNGSGGGPAALLSGSDPLKLLVASYPLSCADPNPSLPWDQCNWTMIQVSFPAAMLEQGFVDMTDPSVGVFGSSKDEPSSQAPGDCGSVSAVGGGIVMASITFGEIGESTVPVTIAGFGGPNAALAGTHQATICP